MWSKKSFQEILQEKIQSAKSSHHRIENTPRLPSAHASPEPHGYWQITPPTTRLKLTCHIGYEVKPPPKPSVQWSPRQIEILREFIELGAEIETDSPYRVIKRAYRRLLIKYHPDHCQSADEFTLKRHSRILEKIVQSFREFDSAGTKSGAAA